jgi:hypothetical protein
LAISIRIHYFVGGRSFEGAHGIKESIAVLLRPTEQGAMIARASIAPITQFSGTR